MKDFGHCCLGKTHVCSIYHKAIVYLLVYNFVLCCPNRWGIEMLPCHGFSSYPKPIKPPPPSTRFCRSVLRECSCSCLARPFSASTSISFKKDFNFFSAASPELYRVFEENVRTFAFHPEYCAYTVKNSNILCTIRYHTDFATHYVYCKKNVR